MKPINVKSGGGLGGGGWEGVTTGLMWGISLIGGIFNNNLFVRIVDQNSILGPKQWV